MATGRPSAYRYFEKAQSPLRFREDGTFRILHLTDIHEVSPEMDDDENRQIPVDKSIETLNVIEKCLEKADADLVVFGGDNISGFWEEFTFDYMAESIRKIVAPVAKRNIPLAIVFGNHDSERADRLPFLHRENQIPIYCEYENFRGIYNEEDVYGCCNYSLQILSHDSDRVNWNIWCVDSNDYPRGEQYCIAGPGYDVVHKDQIEWYEKKAAELKAENGGKTVPSILFQHIPVIQESEFLKEVPEGTEGAVRNGERWFAPKENAFSQGVMREHPCPPPGENGQFESWKKTGDIAAAFFGHDHVNTFVGELDGIKLVQTIGAGYHTYGSERGGRIIVLHENSREFDTETITVDRITDTVF